MLLQHYSHGSSGYNPESESSDSSKPVPGSANVYQSDLLPPPSPAEFVPDNKPIIATNETIIYTNGTVIEPENLSNVTNIPEIPNEGLIKDTRKNIDPKPSDNTNNNGNGGLMIVLIIGSIILVVIIGIIIYVKMGNNKNKTFATGG